MNPLGTRLGRLCLRSPVIMASGTFGYGSELRGVVDYRDIGAIVTKTITRDPWEGNPQPRIWETASGIINSIGLQNPGLADFLREKLPALKGIGPRIVVSVSASDPDETAELAGLLKAASIDGIELNLSCPNFRRAAAVAAQSTRLTRRIVDAARRRCGAIPLIAKLSPSVTDIVSIALAAQDAGADVLNLVNTVRALAVDVQGGRVIAGGLSGPCIKPIGLRAVYETYRKVSIPIIGTGGVQSGADALEYLLAGASAVSVGSSLFSKPSLASEICGFLRRHLREAGTGSIRSLVGSLNEKTSRRCRRT